MVRARQLLHVIRRRLLAVPLAFVVGAIALAQLMVRIDGRVGDGRLPRFMETTVDSGRAMLTAIAGGLISSITLLLSLVLVAVQLASSQYSPRTLRDWTGDRTQQVAIGLVLGTAVYCLLVLRETRSFGEGSALTPHLSVLLAVMLGVLSLIAVVRAVDHLTSSLRVGSVAQSLMEQTVELVRQRDRDLELERPTLGLAPTATPSLADTSIPLDALAVTADRPGWIQQIDEDALFAAIPEGSIAQMEASLGTFVMPDQPMVWVWPPPVDDECQRPMRAAIAIGDERTLQQDVGYGILQLVDIAVKALSPGVNDPNTANDVIVNLGVVLLAIWERSPQPEIRQEGGRTLVRRDLSHGELLEATFGPLRRYGRQDAGVVMTMLRTLVALRNEVVRRALPGPVEPISATIESIRDAFERSEPDPIDREAVAELLATIDAPLTAG